MRAVVTSRKRLPEDAWGAVRGDDGTHAVWVVDGATPLDARDPVTANAQVAYFAWALSRFLQFGLTKALRQEPSSGGLTGEELSAMVEEARRRAQLGFGARFGRAACPTATLSLVVRAGQDLLAWTIGDSPLWIETDDGIVTVTDPQYEDGEERVLQRWRELRAGGLSAGAAYREVLDGQAASRERRNTPEGLWILGSDERAAAHGRLRRLREPAPVRVVVLSDGLERCVSPFHLVTRQQLFDSLHAGTALDSVRRLRHAEAADPARTRVPRLTAHDDITGVAVVL